MDVFVFTPVYRLEPETVKALFSLEWDGPVSLLLQRDNPSGDPHADHLHQYQRAREIFLAGRYDAMLVIESDIIPPENTLKRLAKIKADVVYGCYLMRAGKIVNIQQRYKRWPETSRNIGESLTPKCLWKAAKRMGVVECSGGGLGCILIHRRVLEAVPFQYYDRDIEPFFDYSWTSEVHRRGFKMMADTGVKCGHKDTNGEILCPS